MKLFWRKLQMVWLNFNFHIFNDQLIRLQGQKRNWCVVEKSDEQNDGKKMIKQNKFLTYPDFLSFILLN